MIRMCEKRSFLAAKFEEVRGVGGVGGIVEMRPFARLGLRSVWPCVAQEVSR